MSTSALGEHPNSVSGTWNSWGGTAFSVSISHRGTSFSKKKSSNKDTQLFSQYKIKCAIYWTNVRKVVRNVHYYETKAEWRQDWILDLLSSCSQEHDRTLAPHLLDMSVGRVGRQSKPPGENKRLKKRSKKKLLLKFLYLCISSPITESEMYTFIILNWMINYESLDGFLNLFSCFNFHLIIFYHFFIVMFKIVAPQSPSHILMINWMAEFHFMASLLESCAVVAYWFRMHPVTVISVGVGVTFIYLTPPFTVGIRMQPKSLTEDW